MRTTYKFRCECQADFYRAIKNVTFEQLEITQLRDKKGGVFPDMVVTITNDMTISEWRNRLSQIVDGHVMLQTIQPIDKYTGVRDTSIEGAQFSQPANECARDAVDESYNAAR